MSKDIANAIVGAVSKVLSNYHGLLSARSAPESTFDHEESDPDKEEVCFCLAGLLDLILTLKLTPVKSRCLLG